ncbi:hypothetical protein SASPL_139674 [Salvia splendens]|uniref:Large ribosomal subunit protein bL32m n=1 Tax=Salvia splendens TaxID=180675 RepID=A0A8X8ZBR6_SALSN|nr:hypothetical protein SASPL_139674 [Salvia splendens]
MLRYGFQRLTHSLAQPAPLATAINHHFSITLPENHHENNSGSHFIDSPFSGGAMELMAVPKRKVSPHRRGIRNGPKALKPVPVIIKCKIVAMRCAAVSSYLTSSVAAGSSQILKKTTIRTAFCVLDLLHILKFM